MSPVLRCFALLGALSLGWLFPALDAQERPPAFGDRVDVRVVNVEVVVTDGDGHRVTDLVKEDFEVFEDGKAVEVTNFYTIDGSAAADAPTAAPLEAPVAAPEPAAEQRLHLLVYVDNFNLRAHQRNQVLDSLAGFLEERAARGDLVMILTHGLGLEVVIPFTADRARIAEALAKVRQSQTHGEVAATRQNVAARQIAHALSDPLTANQAAELFRSHRDVERQNLLQSVRALASGVRALVGLEGRKTLIYVSGGLALEPGGELAERFFGGSGAGGGESSLFQAVVREAHASQVTFYAFDAAGKGGGSLTAERGDEISGGSGRAAADAMAKLNLQQPLLDMAAPTGGTAFLGSNNFETAALRLAADLDTFYSLGFRPSAPGDGRFHRIEVKVRRPGLSVRHREGFLDKPDLERIADRTLSALLTGAGENPLGAAISFGVPEKKKSKSFLLPILVRVPLREIALLPNGDNVEGRLQICLAVQDEEGGLSDVRQTTYPISIPQAQLEAARESALGYQMQLEIRPGNQKIAIGVLDEASGIESFTQEVVLVGKDTQRGRR